jgi:hypothetical protein
MANFGGGGLTEINEHEVVNGTAAVLPAPTFLFCNFA